MKANEIHVLLQHPELTRRASHADRFLRHEIVDDGHLTLNGREYRCDDNGYSIYVSSDGSEFAVPDEPDFDDILGDDEF